MIKYIKKKLYAALSARMGLEAWPPGHYYSAIPKFDQSKQHAVAIEDYFTTNALRLDPENIRQEINLLYHNASTVRNFLMQPDIRYDINNSFFSYLDAVYLMRVVETYRPRQIIEVGGGHTTDLLLDCLDYFGLGTTKLSTIEPFPERLADAVKHPQITLLPIAIEDADLRLFESLEAGDILFIDSSHVVKSGSDVLHIFNRLLPRLSAGVVIHFHDIFIPDDYPSDWFVERRAWNESYFLQAFLMYNNAFNTLFASHLASRYCSAELTALSSKIGLSCVGGGSFWLKRTA